MIEYTQRLEDITPAMLEGFFDGWPHPPSPDTHLRILKGSTHVVLAIDQGPSRVVGFVTAITDGVLTAHIPLLEVLPSHQRQGIGAELLRRLFEHLREYYAVDLICDPSMQPYYQRMGMQAARGMMIRNYARQAGRGGRS